LPSILKDLFAHQVQPSLGDIRLTELRPQHLQRLYAQKIDSGLSPRTVQYIHAVIHRTLGQAFKWGLVVRNVADLVESPRPEKKPHLTFSALQCQILLATLKDDRLYPLYTLAFLGLQPGELLGLHWEDVSFESRTISIRHTLTALPHRGLVLGEPKSEKTRRSVILPDFAVQALAAHQAQTAIRTGFMFTTANSTRFPPATRSATLPNC
jgi:integrase